ALRGRVRSVIQYAARRGERAVPVLAGAPPDRLSLPLHSASSWLYINQYDSRTTSCWRRSPTSEPTCCCILHHVHHRAVPRLAVPGSVDLRDHGPIGRRYVVICPR